MSQKRLDKFKEFLTARGAEILIPTNEYELIRFKAKDKVSIIYTGRRGETFTGEAAEAWHAFETNIPWNGGNRVVNRLQNRSVKSRTIRQRDGDACFYCGKSVSFEEESIEHFLPMTHGGTNHISNLALAHKKCNTDAGHLPIMAKIKLRDKMIYGSITV